MRIRDWITGCLFSVAAAFGTWFILNGLFGGVVKQEQAVQAAGEPAKELAPEYTGPVITWEADPLSPGNLRPHHIPACPGQRWMFWHMRPATEKRGALITYLCEVPYHYKVEIEYPVEIQSLGGTKEDNHER